MVEPDRSIGFLSGPEFGRKAALRIAIFVVLIVASPYVAMALIALTFAIGIPFLVLAPWLPTSLIAVFIWSMIPLCWRRMRGLGLPAFCGLIVPLLFFANGSFLFAPGM